MRKRRTRRRRSSGHGMWWLFPVVFLLLGVFVFSVLGSGIWEKQSLPGKLEKLLPERIEALGLKDVSVSAGKVGDNRICTVEITCSNWDTLSFEEMYLMQSEIDTAAEALTEEVTEEIFGILVGTIHCNGDDYDVMPYTKSIYRNQTQIHSDYQNSESHQSVLDRMESTDEECALSHCDARSRKGSLYCHRHSCCIESCPNQKDPSAHCCSTHSCAEDHCAQHRYDYAESIYCQAHYVQHYND